MSSIHRSVERNIVRNKLLKEQGNTHGFRQAWYDYHYGRNVKVNGDGSTTVIRHKKRQKKVHYDNGNILLRQLRLFKQMVKNAKQKKVKEEK